MDPVKALKQVAFHLERAGEPTYRVQAFRNAAAVLADLAPAKSKSERNSARSPI